MRPMVTGSRHKYQYVNRTCSDCDLISVSGARGNYAQFLNGPDIRDKYSRHNSDGILSNIVNFA